MSAPEPLWRPEDLGKPIGGSIHAISACLPTWKDVVGYEENDVDILQALQCGYPRFYIHPIIQNQSDQLLIERGGEQQFGLLYLTKAAALQAQAYLRSKTSSDVSIYEYQRHSLPYFQVVVSSQFENEAKYYWRLAGDGMSSRAAQYFGQNEGAVKDWNWTSDTQQNVAIIQARLAKHYSIDPSDVYIFPSGMSAILHLQLYHQLLNPDSCQVQLGFPYVDTWKLLQEFSAHPHIFLQHDEDSILNSMGKLEGRLRRGCVFSEAPSNPLLETPDVEVLFQLCEDHEAFSFIDDTIASSVNINPMPYAHAITTSLSKWFNGQGDILGGAILLNDQKNGYRGLKEQFQKNYQLNVFHQDLECLARQSENYSNRVKKASLNAQKLVELLRKHPAIAKIYYAGAECDDAYAKVRRPDGKIPGLFSLILDESRYSPERFYDFLEISKGPSLGTDWSLVCPYTLLAHYSELDWVESCGVSRNLIRVSVGIEELGWIYEKFEKALKNAKI